MNSNSLKRQDGDRMARGDVQSTSDHLGCGKDAFDCQKCKEQRIRIMGLREKLAEASASLKSVDDLSSQSQAPK